MKRLALSGAVLMLALSLSAQKVSKKDRPTFQNLQKHIKFLSSDQLEGRRTGTDGEARAAAYIADQFKALGLQMAGADNSYLQPFSVDDGKAMEPNCMVIINGNDLKQDRDFFVFPWSPRTETQEFFVSPSLQESGVPWFRDLGEVLAQQAQNPHFDLNSWLLEESRQAAAKGATALFVTNLSDKEDGLKFDPRDKNPESPIPVYYVRKQSYRRVIPESDASFDVKYCARIGRRSRTGHNVVAYANNGAEYTIIIGAHYDHLGYGEDGNSMLRTGSPAIHNGADDNASGTSAMLELARLLQTSRKKPYNYLFIAFSGEELGLYGSKYFTENPTVDLKQVNYMINLDMVGRLNDSSRTLTVGGYGTSPVWSEIISTNPKQPFQIKVDSSGTGPSDHTSFYRKDIPVLFFFTGLHGDYHRPGDDAEKINYAGTTAIVNYITDIVNRTSAKSKLAFTRTREQQTTTSARFSVSMGIMPDYTFSGAGVKVDGVSEGRPAAKAGIQAGDVLVQLGDIRVTSLEQYMQGLSKFKKGDSTQVKVKRGEQELTFPIQF